VAKFKFNAIFGLKPGIDPDETYQEWREEHVLYVKKLTLPEVGGNGLKVSQTNVRFLSHPGL